MCAYIWTEAEKQTMKGSGWQIIGDLFLNDGEQLYNSISPLGGMGWIERRNKGFACVLKKRKKSQKIGLAAVSLVSARAAALARLKDHIQCYATE